MNLTNVVSFYGLMLSVYGLNCVSLQLLMERAEWLMNQAAAGEVGWDKIRADVADSYSQAGLISAARFITATL